MKKPDTIFCILVTAGVALIIFVAWGLILHTDAYQKFQAQKKLRHYLSETNIDLTLKQSSFVPQIWIVASNENQPLALKQIITGREPDLVTFEVSVQFNKLRGAEYLRLVVEPRDDEDQAGLNEGFLECLESTNGNCLLEWTPKVVSPGSHHLRAMLYCPHSKKKKNWVFMGPILTLNESNLVRSITTP